MTKFIASHGMLVVPRAVPGGESPQNPLFRFWRPYGSACRSCRSVNSKQKLEQYPAMLTSGVVSNLASFPHFIGIVETGQVSFRDNVFIV